jgi:hypothetical protein
MNILARGERRCEGNAFDPKPRATASARNGAARSGCASGYALNEVGQDHGFAIDLAHCSSSTTNSGGKASASVLQKLSVPLTPSIVTGTCALAR